MNSKTSAPPVKSESIPSDLQIVFAPLPSPNNDQIRQIIDLYREAGWWTLPHDDPDQIRGIVHGSHCFMVAFQGQEIIAMGRAISDRTSDAYIQDVTVRNEFKHKSIGTRIITEILARLQKDGLEWIGLIAERNSHEFYDRLGFKQMPDSMPMIFERR